MVKNNAGKPAGAYYKFQLIRATLNTVATAVKQKQKSHLK
jgi:hypothetical protein